VPVAIRRVGVRLGRRGAVLMLLGVVWLLIGAFQILQPPPPANRAGLYLLTLLAPYEWWGGVWIAASLAAVTAAPRMASDTYGFVALMVPPWLWTLVNLAGWALGQAPRGWAAAMVYAALASMIMVVAGWPEPRTRRL
jgi:hypothetical protein